MVLGEAGLVWYGKEGGGFISCHITRVRVVRSTNIGVSAGTRVHALGIPCL